MKRKNLEGVYDDFSSFPFYPSPRKSRRLCTEIEIVDEDEMLTSSSSMVEKDDAEIIKAVHSIDDRRVDDRALVLFYPNTYAPILRPIAGPGFSVIVNSNQIPSFNGHVLKLNDINNSLIQVMMNEIPTQSINADQNRCLGIVPWLAPQKHQQYSWLQKPQEAGPSVMPMDTEESDFDMMETDNANTNYSVQEFQFEGFKSHLQHSMMPHFQQNTLTHITR